MADLKYSAELDDKISPRLKKIQENTEKLQSKMAGLSSAIAGLAIGAAIGKVFQFANQITDLSDATNVATKDIVAFTTAVQQNGGSAEQAQQGITKLVASIGDAAAGGDKAQEAFSKVGVTLDDLRTLSEGEIFKKTVQGLGQIEDTSTRAKIQAELLGKSLRGVNMSGAANTFKNVSQSSKDAATAIESLGAASQKVNNVINNLQLSLAKSVKPLADFINKMDEEKIQKVADAIIEISVQLAALAGSIYVLEKLAKVALFFAGSITAITSGFALLVGTMKSFRIMKAGYLKDIAAGVSRHDALNKTTEVFMNKRLPYITAGVANLAKGMLGLGAAIWVIDSAMKAVFGKSLSEYANNLLSFNIRLDESDQRLKRFLSSLQKAGLIQMTNPMDQVIKDQNNATDQMRNNSRKAQKEFMENQKKSSESIRGVTSAIQKQVDEINNLAKAFANANNELIKNIQFETTLIGKTENVQDIERQVNDLRKRSRDEIEKLIESKAKLGDSEKGLAKIYDEQIAKIQQQTAVDEVRLRKAIINLQSATLLEKARLEQIENTNRALEEQIQRQNQLGDVLQRINDQRVDLEFERAQQGRSPLEQQIEQIKENARKAALEAGRAFAAAFDNEDGLSPEKAEELAKGLEMIAKRYEDIANMQIQNLEASMTWEAGWKDAFDKYIDNATNAANRARDVFSAVTSGMERLISDFVDTGKFKFKDFARSVIAEILKIEMKAAASNLWKIIAGSMGGGGGGLFGGSIIPGFLAEGGPAIANKPYIVGERGPELFVPKGTGTVVPNNQLGASQPVTNNYVYNISAVDAQSVARLFANNRQVLLGSVEQAKKELPTRRGMR